MASPKLGESYPIKEVWELLEDEMTRLDPESEVDMSYIASLFDSRSVMRIHGASPNVRLKANRPNTLMGLEATFGGISRYNWWEGKRLFYFVWEISGEKAVNMLRCVVPFMHSRQAEAQILIDFFDAPKKSATRDVLATNLRRLQVNPIYGAGALPIERAELHE